VAISNGGWTIETLKEYVDSVLAQINLRNDQRFKDSQTAVDAALNAAKEAVTKQEAASEKRFESVNEFRAQMGDQQRTLMPRPEAELRMGSLEGRVADLAKAVTSLGAEKKGGREAWAWVFSGVMALIAIGSLIAAFAAKK
jgi:hypothetical protein